MYGQFNDANVRDKEFARVKNLTGQWSMDTCAKIQSLSLKEMKQCAE